MLLNQAVPFNKKKNVCSEMVFAMARFFLLLASVSFLLTLNLNKKLEKTSTLINHFLLFDCRKLFEL